MLIQLFRHPRARFRLRVGRCLKRPTWKSEPEDAARHEMQMFAKRIFAKRLVDGVRRTNGVKQGVNEGGTSAEIFP